MKDNELIELLKKDPERGMTALMKEYSGIVCTVVRGKLNGKFVAQDVEECVSDVFCEFYRKLDRYEPARGSIKAFLCILAKHTAVDYVREHNARADLLPLEEGSAGDTLCFPDAEENEETLKERLLYEINSLPEVEREIIVRKYFLFQPSKEISKALGMKVSAVDTRVHRILKKLREKLGGNKL